MQAGAAAAVRASVCTALRAVRMVDEWRKATAKPAAATAAYAAREGLLGLALRSGSTEAALAAAEPMWKLIAPSCGVDEHIPA